MIEAIGPALKVFYDKVRTTPETKKFFSSDQHMDAAKGRQEQHWSVITDASFSETYAHAVRGIGKTHARFCLEPRWYIGGYALVVERLIHAVIKDGWPGLCRTASAAPATWRQPYPASSKPRSCFNLSRRTRGEAASKRTGSPIG